MNDRMTYHPHKMAAFEIEMYGSYSPDTITANKPTGRGTAFLYRHENRDYLITSRHCILPDLYSGSGDPVEYLAARVVSNSPHIPFQSLWPDYPHGNPRQCPMPPQQEADGWEVVPHPVRLYRKDDHGHMSPLWYEHPERPDYDIVAIPWISPPCIPSTVHLPVNNIAMCDAFPVVPGGDAFLAAYAPSKAGGSLSDRGFALWLPGVISTDPALGLNVGTDELPVIQVSTVCHPGMSGAPVYAASPQRLPPCSTFCIMAGGRHLRFLGVFASSALPGPTHSLGMVWDAALIQQIVEKGRRPTIDDLKREKPRDWILDIRG